MRKVSSTPIRSVHSELSVMGYGEGWLVGLDEGGMAG